MARYPLNLPLELKKEAEIWAKEQGVSLNQFILWSVAEKVGELRQRLDDPAYPQVQYRRSASGLPTPVLRSTGIRVQTVVIASQDWGWTPEKIADEYDLTPKQVREGLGFYQTHRAEIDAQIRLEADPEKGID